MRFLPPTASKRGERGFTLIELLVVVLIISFISSVTLANLNSVRAKGRDAVRISNLTEIRKAMLLFYEDNGRYPNINTGGSWLDVFRRFQRCLQSPSNVVDSCNMAVTNTAPYMSKVPQDPRGDSPNTYIYYHCQTGQRYRLRAVLERDNIALRSDIDGSLVISGDGLCNDGLQYCLGTPDDGCAPTPPPT